MALGIITRGLGTASTIVTRGFGTGGIIAAVVQEIQRRAVIGSSAYKKTLERIIVGAKLLRINDEEPDMPIVGQDSRSRYVDNDPRTKAYVAATWIGIKVKRVTDMIVIKAAELLKVRKGSRGND